MRKYEKSAEKFDFNLKTERYIKTAAFFEAEDTK